MADLEDPWEGTVATAARDACWLAAGTQGLPGLYASLSGRVENKHGDTLFQAGARFFLFELKGGPSLLSTEWTDTRVVVVGGKKERVPNPKPPHQAFVKKALGWNPKGARTRRVQAKYSRPVLHEDGAVLRVAIARLTFLHSINSGTSVQERKLVVLAVVDEDGRRFCPARSRRRLLRRHSVGRHCWQMTAAWCRRGPRQSPQPEPRGELETGMRRKQGPRPSPWRTVQSGTPLSSLTPELLRRHLRR